MAQMSSWSSNMQPAYTQQTYGQYMSTPGQNSASGSPSRPRSVRFDSMTPGFAQRVAPCYDAQLYTAQDIYRDQLASAVPTGPRYVNDAYGRGSAIAGYDFNPIMAGPWGGLTSQPQHNGDYLMPNIPYNNLEQGETNYAGYHFGAYQVPGSTVNFSPYLPEANLINQNPSPTWRFDDCWVSHAEQDKIHLTIALKKT